jgi:serine protease Do
MRRRRSIAALLLLAGACKSRPAPEPAPEPAPAAAPKPAVATGGVPAAEGSAKTAAPAATGSFVELVKRLNPAVVAIKTTTRRGYDPLAAYFGVEPEPEVLSSLGSGVIIDAGGWVITNDHVVAAGEDVHVALADGREVPARVVGRDAEIDVALLEIDAQNLTAAPLGDSDLIEVGEWVVVIGNPFGLENTVTAGIVSAVGRTTRDVPVGERSVYQTFIQTDASINPGNSGGPMINTAGQVVGIATAVDARGGGIGFAIPINLVKDLVPHLRRDGRLVRSWLGVYLHPVSAELAERVGLDRPRGVFVSGIIRGSPADKAGIVQGDVILAFDGRPVDEHTLPWRVAVAGPGRKVPVEMWRGGAERTIEVGLERLPE